MLDYMTSDDNEAMKKNKEKEVGCEEMRKA